jgi:DNA replication protein DnaC
MASFRANFRNQKTLEEFDFSFNPNINRSLILDLASCRFISEKVCAFIIGPCGTGKSHLAQALKSLDFYAINSMG